MYNQVKSISEGSVIIERVKELKGKRNSPAYISNDVLAEGIGYSGRSVKAWLAGQNPFPVDALLKMCDFFQCDIGYLTGEIDTPRHITADICEETGLSEEAANALRQIAGKIPAVISDESGSRHETVYIQNSRKGSFYSFLIERHQQLFQPIMKILDYEDKLQQVKEQGDYEVILEAYKIASRLDESQQKEGFESEMRRYYAQKADNIATADEKTKNHIIEGCMLANAGLFEALQFADSSSNNRKVLEFSTYDVYLDIVKEFIKREEANAK